MDTTLDDVAFLALSENRIALLEVLSDEQTHSRDELMEATDVSRPTLARILDDLETRVWITQHGQNCQITPLGAWVHEEFTELLEMMETAQQLRDVMRWFPTDDVDVLIRHLRDAELVFATESDPTAPIRRACEQLRAGTQLRFLTSQVTVWYFSTLRSMVIQNGMTVQGVVTPDVYDTLMNNPALAAICEEMYDSGDVSFFVTDGSLPIVQITDGNVGIGLIDAAKNPQGLILSDDEAILEWAEEIFESYREKASFITPDGFPQRQVTQDQNV